MPSPTTQDMSEAMSNEYPSKTLTQQWWEEWAHTDMDLDADEYVANKACDWQRERLSADLARATSAGMERAAMLIPDSWLDPLLTGKDGIMLPAGCPEIEKLLDGLRQAIRSEASRLQPPTPLPETAKRNEA